MELGSEPSRKLPDNCVDRLPTNWAHVPHCLELAGAREAAADVASFAVHDRGVAWVVHADDTSHVTEVGRAVRGQLM